MTIKYLLSAAAIVGALAIGVPAMAADSDMQKPAKPMHHTSHHATHHKAAKKSTSAKPMKKSGHMHHASSHKGMKGGDAQAREETMKLNQQQLQMNGIQH